ncbi:ECF RNA polymerase sigma factor SigW [compost metagenome]
MDTEQQLIERCQSGDKNAFSLLVRPHLQRAYSTALAILGAQHFAEDAVQNALFEAYKAVMEGRDIRRFGGWLTHVVARRALDIARQKHRQQHTTEENELLEVRDDTASPITDVLQKEQRNELMTAIMRLNINQRTVIVMYYYQEMKIGEIANLLNIKEGTVKSRLHQARITLSKLVPIETAKQKVRECQ